MYLVDKKMARNGSKRASFSYLLSKLDFIFHFCQDWHIFWKLLVIWYSPVSMHLVYLISLGCRKDLKLCCIIKMPLVPLQIFGRSFLQFLVQIFNLPGIFNFLVLPQRLETLLHHQNAACFYAKDFHVLRTSERKPDVAASA